MHNLNKFRIGLLCVMVVLGSLASVMYALAYTQRREVIYTNTITVEANEVKFRGFYLSAPAGLFEVTLKVSEGSIKWTPHSAVMFEDTLGWFPKRITQDTFGKIQRWVCETSDGTVKWSVDQENVNMVWYINFFNEDDYDKEVQIEISKVWEEQNYQNWM
ncbi:MAG: hypothetical protein NWF03_05095 [Candidatus Bathyarchaeota archaeon]|nr:hypothetical protein [Candidatus Bathyarchaeota archaeon]